MADMTESDIDSRNFRLKCDHEIKSLQLATLRLAAAIASPSTRAIVHKALTGEVISGTISVYGTDGSKTQWTAADYCLAARQKDYDDALTKLADSIECLDDD